MIVEFASRLKQFDDLTRHWVQSLGKRAGDQAGRQEDRQADRQTDRQTDRHADRQTDGHTDTQTDATYIQTHNDASFVFLSMYNDE